MSMDDVFYDDKDDASEELEDNFIHIPSAKEKMDELIVCTVFAACIFSASILTAWIVKKCEHAQQKFAEPQVKQENVQPKKALKKALSIERQYE